MQKNYIKDFNGTKTEILSELFNEMQETELYGRTTEHNDRLVSDFAVSRRQSRSLYRNWIALSKKPPGYVFQSQSNVASRISLSTGNDVNGITESSCSLIEDRADEIVRHMEQSETLMEDNPKSNNDRIETLRVMTEYLTLKRTVKKKLTTSIAPKSKALSLTKRVRYRISIFFCKVPITVKNFLNNFELWYSSLKVIEGHFGSSVASYFKFLRKLFLLNACIFILILLFIMIPQLLFRFIQFVDVDKSLFWEEYEENATNTVKTSSYVMIKRNPYKDNGDFRLGNLFTGEGFLTNTILFYGYYTNTSLKFLEGYNFNIPASYFFTSAVSYFLIFFFLFTSVAVSYRKCYIEASGGMNNTFSNKIFCGWDFGIATRQAAELKSKSIFIEIRELLDEVSRSKKKKSCAHTFYTTAISFSLNGILIFLLGVGGIYSWKYLDQQMVQADTATTMMIWLILTLVIAVAPVLFSLITHIESFESQSSALYMTLIRTFTLYAVVVAVVVAYRLNGSTQAECWETILGQDMYRLVLLDFIFGLLGTALSEFIRYRIFVTMWEGIGCPEFDIARSTMNLIYNQTLFYIGLYFSPALSLIITVKMFITFYIKKWGAIYNCKPFMKPWRASQAHTVYLSIAFFSFFSVVIAYGYIITSVKTSNCGPFRGGKYIYMSILDEILANKDSTILTILYYITRPGVVGIVLMALVLGVYYMRAVALARIHVVNHLRHLLLLKAEDRKLLLNEISKYTKPHQTQINGIKPAFFGEGSSLTNLTYNTAIPSDIRRKQERQGGESLEMRFPECEKTIKQSKLSPSSLINLCQEIDEPLNRTRNCNSAQNLSSTACSNDNKGSHKEELDTDKVNDVSMNGDFLTSSPKDEKEICSPRSDSEEIDLQDGTSAQRNHRLNFNPIFTESFPLENFSTTCENYEEEPNGSTFIDKRLGKERKKEDLNNTSQNNCDIRKDFANYVRFQERVPSRISFDAKTDRNHGKKKKRN